jgi:hypothetical protein
MEYSDHKKLSLSKLGDTFSGAVGGVIGTLLLNLVIPQTEGLYLVLVFILPGLFLGAVIGYFLSGKMGRPLAAFLSGFASFIAVLIVVLLMVRD